MDAVGQPTSSAHDSLLHKGGTDAQPTKPTGDTSTTIWKAVVAVTILSAVSALVGGIYVLTTGHTHVVIHFPLSDFGAEAIALLVTVAVTTASDALGYVHYSSLRWALYREGRLEYNTNFRLFTGARTSLPNRWYMNLLSGTSSVLCYASASVFIVKNISTRGGYAANGVGLVCLGLGLLGQAVVCILCLRHCDKEIPSWSPNPLQTTRVCVEDTGTIVTRPGRCMQSVCQTSEPAQPTEPALRHPRLWRMRCTRWIVVLLWILCAVSFGWAGIIIYLIETVPAEGSYHFKFDWNINGFDSVLSTVEFSMNQVYNNGAREGVNIPMGVQFFFAILFLCLIQGLQFLALHCIEFLVNLMRDEQIWRKAGSSAGSSLCWNNPLFAALSSWQAVILVVLKTALHWLLGQSLIASYFIADLIDGDTYTAEYPKFGRFIFNMSASRLLVYATGAALTAGFTTLLAFWPLRGSQPVTWGHLQTLADLIDDWDAPEGKLWWGDKGGKDDVRHAGTAGRRDIVGPIHMHQLYAGERM